MKDIGFDLTAGQNKIIRFTWAGGTNEILFSFLIRHIFRGIMQSIVQIAY